jgi:hypothetical protein
MTGFISATVSGKQIDYLNPDPAQINLDDLSKGLAAHPRYTGQTVRPWSVAQHSLLVAALVPEEDRLHALLHDAPEAYLCDVPSPAKAAMRAIAQLNGHQSPYDVIERDLWKAVCTRYDISHELPDSVLHADRLAMAIEAPVLQPKGWMLPIWDFARPLVAPDYPARAAQLMAGIAVHSNGGGVQWALDVVSAIVRRKAAA